LQPELENILAAALRFLQNQRPFFCGYLRSGCKGGSTVGMGGSMARFTIVGERLYTVGNHELKTFNISNAEALLLWRKTRSDLASKPFIRSKETVIGSTSGMFIYAISNPDQPQKLSEFSHVRSCDPVIADDQNAYVTLRPAPSAWALPTSWKCWTFRTCCSHL
jgi:hypothetical protein